MDKGILLLTGFSILSFPVEGRYLPWVKETESHGGSRVSVSCIKTDSHPALPTKYHFTDFPPRDGVFFRWYWGWLFLHCQCLSYSSIISWPFSFYFDAENQNHGLVYDKLVTNETNGTSSVSLSGKLVFFLLLIVLPNNGREVLEGSPQKRGCVNSWLLYGPQGLSEPIVMSSVVPAF